MKVSNLTKKYENKTVLSVPDFDFTPGKIYAVIGANGSGKSTFLKVLSGIIKSDSKGTTLKDTLGGENKFCYMPQKNYAFKTSTLNNVLLTSKNPKADTPRAMELMKEMKIDHLAKQRASKLSGGETARMALCRLVMSRAQIVLLDEPTASMDIESTLLSEKLIRKYNETEHATVIMVTHSINQAKRLADEVIFMKDGQIVEHGATSNVLSTPKEADTKEFLEFFSAEI